MNATQMTTFEALEARQLFADFAGGGALDTSFNHDGKADIDISKALPNHALLATDVAVQSDGKVVVVGSFGLANGTSTDEFAIARYNADGSLDKTFGRRDVPGVQFLHIGKIDGREGASAVAIQPDGKIVVAGTSEVARRLQRDGTDFAVVRLMSDGRLDSSFDGDGIRTIHFHDDANAEGVAIQRDGKIVVAGGDHNINLLSSDDKDFAVARLNPNGSLDSSFDGDGKVVIGMGGDDFAHALAIDSTGTAATNPNFGKIIVAGDSDKFRSTAQVAVARLNPNGKLDNTFGDGGRAFIAQPGNDTSTASSVLVQPGSKIVIGGHVGRGANPNKQNNQFLVARLTSTGRLDNSFGPSGNAFVETDFHGNDQAHDLIASPDGGIIAAGTTFDSGSNFQFAIAKYSANGVLDSRFGIGGGVLTDFGQPFDCGIAAAPGKRFVVAGGIRFRTARYLDAGAFVSNPTHLTTGGTLAIARAFHERTVFSDRLIDELN